MKHFTHEYMKANCGCYSDAPGKLESCSFMNSNPVSLMDIVTSEIPLKDKYWFVCRKVATKEQNQRIAIDVSEMVLPIYESKYPNDRRPREAIEAAKKFISGHISIETLIEKRRAAYAAADDDAYAAAAAYATAYATAYAAAAADDDAYAAAYATAYAAAAAAADDDTAADAADAADDTAAYAAAADNSMKQSLLDYLISFVNKIS